jgi:hypothetical protein
LSSNIVASLSPAGRVSLRAWRRRAAWPLIECWEAPGNQTNAHRHSAAGIAESID